MPFAIKGNTALLNAAMMAAFSVRGRERSTEPIILIALRIFFQR
ncbi:hypothetical protein SPONN_541 [uncultured Candidatus Thioglobus sp.]|nr:hypothetical protein SPONN_541 [uncultured Candidatus Thioglobus sp.]